MQARVETLKKEVLVISFDPFKDLDDSIVLFLLTHLLSDLLDNGLEIYFVTVNEIHFDPRAQIIPETVVEAIVPMRASLLQKIIKDILPSHYLERIHVIPGQLNPKYQKEAYQDEQSANSKAQAAKEAALKAGKSEAEAERMFTEVFTHAPRQHFSNVPSYLKEVANNRSNFTFVEGLEDLIQTVDNANSSYALSIAPLTDMAAILSRINRPFDCLSAMVGASYRVEHNASINGATESFFSLLTRTAKKVALIPLDITTLQPDKNKIKPDNIANTLYTLIGNFLSTQQKAYLEENLQNMNPIIFTKYGGCALHDVWAALILLDELYKAYDINNAFSKICAAYTMLLELVDTELALVKIRTGQKEQYAALAKQGTTNRDIQFSALIPRVFLDALNTPERVLVSEDGQAVISKDKPPHPSPALANLFESVLEKTLIQLNCQAQKELNKQQFNLKKIQIQQQFIDNLVELRSKLNSKTKKGSVEYQEGRQVNRDLMTAQQDLFEIITYDLEPAQLQSYIQEFQNACSTRADKADQVMGHGWLFHAIEAVVKAVIGLFVGIGMIIGTIFGQGLAKKEHRQEYKDRFFKWHEADSTKSFSEFKEKSNEALNELIQDFDEYYLQSTNP
jgi:hypothetical protein